MEENIVMIQLQQLIKPTWGVETWLNNAWSILNEDEKKDISQRIDEMFHTPIPFQLEHDKALYMHLFSFLAQLEMFGLQGLIKSLEKMAEGDLRRQLRQQIVDEIFHATIFTKLTFELSAPFTIPPPPSKGIETFLSHLVNEHDLKTSIVFVNLVGEGWIEQIFDAMQEHKVAPRIFDVVLADESRHLEDSALLFEMGLPDAEYLMAKLADFEERLITVVFSEHVCVPTLINFLGVVGAKALFNNINKKHTLLLSKIDMVPSEGWQFFMSNVPALIDEAFYDQTKGTVVEVTSTRKIFSALWDEPSQPNVSSLFNIDVSAVNFFEKKHKPETLTCLMLQAVSKTMADNPSIKNFMCNHKIYNPNDSFVGLAVLLPGSGDHLGMIEFKNCHNMHVSEIALHIQYDMKIMLYCYNRVQELKKEHPYLMDLFNDIFVPRSETFFRYPFLARPTVSVSNIGHWGYEAPVSPLFPNETVKYTLAKIDKKQVWNNHSKTFEVKDLLPVGITVDHRVFDANIPLPNMMQAGFDDVFMAMQEVPSTSFSRTAAELDEFIELAEKSLKSDLEFTFRALFLASHVWKNHTGAKIFIKTSDAYQRANVSNEPT